MKLHSIKSTLILLFAASLTACSAQKEAATTEQMKKARPERSVQRQGPPSIDEIFKMDTDLDGLLSKSEVKGPLLEQFATIDSDSDGFISKKELEDAPKPQRPAGGRGRN